ncbi:unnamed protein product [Kuraishia capsulata CBS 1993]|uniref:Uncharacterized protein n=1 Tax=Kuraishia capsulata CBS 1993 TaxID=1382522 RepID=W6MF90_9ASCO|nr:uncharacterized protein KUCA_T00000346001 [Kuraishia capsulata CBS 1993]CDK24384.1 unnamed protein product [Kuraishia capsulata CBS 1993]
MPKCAKMDCLERHAYLEIQNRGGIIPMQIDPFITEWPIVSESGRLGNRKRQKIQCKGRRHRIPFWRHLELLVCLHGQCRISETYAFPSSGSVIDPTIDSWLL